MMGYTVMISLVENNVLSYCSHGAACELGEKWDSSWYWKIISLIEIEWWDIPSWL